MMLIKLGDRDALHKRYVAAKPYLFAVIDGLLDPAFGENGGSRLSQPGGGSLATSETLPDALRVVI